MNKLMKTFRGITLAVGLLSCAGMMPASATAEEQINVRIVGATLGGSVNRSYAAFAQAFMKAFPGANVDILPGGAVANPSRMQRGAGEISHTQTIPLRAASTGRNPTRKNTTP